LLISSLLVQSHGSLVSFFFFSTFLVSLFFFRTSSLLVLFVCYESSLFPVVLLVLYFGYQPEKITASLYLLVYLILFSLPLFFFVVNRQGSVLSCSSELGGFTSFAVSASFIAKSPLYTLHSWLPKAHVEAPLVGSLLLAGIILKFGGYGLLLLGPSLSEISSLWLYLSLIGSLVCSILCFRAWDVKSLVAYSSVVHIGSVTLGVLSGSELGSFVATGMLMAHTLLSPLLFLLASEIYVCNGSRSFLSAHYSSLSATLHGCLVACFGLNFGLPPSLGFFVEVTLFSSIGSVIFCSLFLLGISAFLGFLFCIKFIVASVSGPVSATIGIVAQFLCYLPGLIFCFLSSFCLSFFNVG